MPQESDEIIGLHGTNFPAAAVYGAAPMLPVGSHEAGYFKAQEQAYVLYLAACGIFRPVSQRFIVYGVPLMRFALGRNHTLY
jgi:hypothetical protein